MTLIENILKNPDDINFLEEIDIEEKEIIEQHELIPITDIDIRTVPIYNLDDIDLTKIRLSKPTVFNDKLSVYLVYPLNKKKYSKFYFETPFCFCRYGLDTKKNINNRNDTYWIKTEYINYENMDSDDYKSYDFFQYIVKYLHIKLSEIYDSSLKHMPFLNYENINENPINRFMFNYRKHFFTECLDKTCRRITPFEIPEKVNVKFLLEPLEIWQNVKFYGGTWRIKKLIIDKQV
jgi:hypothetical protein